MGGNDLNTLTNFSFADPNGTYSLSDLKTLDLTSCRLIRIEIMAFHGLQKLKYLILQSNTFAGDMLTPNTLLPIQKSLVKLDISQNLEFNNYLLDAFFETLTNLEEIVLDFSKNNLRPALSKLLSLRRLHLVYSVNGYTEHLSYNMLDAVKGQLVELKLGPLLNDRPTQTYSRTSRRLTIAPAAFLYFSHLAVLDLSWTYLGTDLKEILSLLLNYRENYVCDSTVEKLLLDHVGLYSDTLIDSNMGSLVNLRYLSFAGNALEGIIFLPQNIEVVNLAHNLYTPYVKLSMTAQIPTIPYLREFNISYQLASGTDELQCGKDYSICELNMLPQSLEWIDVSDHGLYFSVMKDTHISTNNIFRRLYARNANSKLKALDRIINCANNVRPRVEYVDLSENKIECINSSIFAYCDWSSMKYLNLRKNLIGQQSKNSCGNDNNTEYLAFLRSLTGLEELNLSENRVDFPLPVNAFQGLLHLKKLKLSSMGLQIFQPSLELKC